MCAPGKRPCVLRKSIFLAFSPDAAVIYRGCDIVQSQGIMMDDASVLARLRRAAASGDHAAVLRLARQAHRLTQAELARKCGYSAATISRFETGRRRLTDTSTLRALARALDIPPGLFGLAPPAPIGLSYGSSASSVTNVVRLIDVDNEDGDGDVRRREMLVSMGGLSGLAIAGTALSPDGVRTRLEAGLAGDTGAPPLPLPELQRRLSGAWKAFTAARYTAVSEHVPGMISSATAGRDASAGLGRVKYTAFLADVYAMACELSVKQGQDGLAWVYGDRALQAARETGMAPSIAAATQSAGMAMRRMGHYTAATDLLVHTALGLGADKGTASSQALASYGSLLCTAAYAAAQHGDRHQAVDLIEEAESAARRLNGAVLQNGGRQRFSAANVTVYRIGVHHALGEDGTALTYAGRVQQHKLGTPERHARFCIDPARAWEGQGKPARAFEALKVAERSTPEELRRPSVRALVGSLLLAPGPTPRGLREMATRVGATS
ncbi:helix-turn-helix domain-containing protein [Actinomadura decatromicini]|uniref:Helix-turn-helix transcriptional regulator n=1 Tax=Actinomadura decatromicini TaxID=2604572 RepID=A0A5D3F7V5_9ACTN|nr:helix-turn-helix transcriptional regulator [Actinomadura decatromicini]TYK43415.1 helix-turn-helix transcriptional regulator [Actinomadura decatromicini]